MQAPKELRELPGMARCSEMTLIKINFCIPGTAPAVNSDSEQIGSWSLTTTWFWRANASR